MENIFNTSSNFVSLSLKDLIEARDLFHYHLINKKNVVATAIGLYRIRKTDPWLSKNNPKDTKKTKQNSRRTLFNSEIRPYSWPCVYVFVSRWEKEAELARDFASDVVPKTLYLPDGRTVPVCVIEAKKQSYASDLKIDVKNLYPRNYFAPGVPIVNDDAQGLKRLSTVGCIVKDGENFYALTNQHTLGSRGTGIKAIKGYIEQEIGVTSSKGINRKEFKDVYPHFQSSCQYLLMDIGLVELNDITEWKTEVKGIDPVEDVLDLYDNSFTLQLIGKKVVGQSAVTGRIRGEIHGLFYRYKSMGGYEYLSDFLIGPETCGKDIDKLKESGEKNISLQIHHGDSGTLLFIEHQDPKNKKKFTYHPFSILWGKNEFIEERQRRVQPFALATSLSTVLNQLNLDFVKDINLDNDFTWGYLGHYLIGSKLPFTVDLLSSAKLKKFIDKNYSLLTLEADNIMGNDPKVLKKDENGENNLDNPYFVALADVPDNVWKNNVNFYIEIEADGTKKRKSGPGARGDFDNANHFADVDLPYKGFDTFLEFNLSDPDTNLKPEIWLEYYKSLRPRYEQWAKDMGETKPAPEYKHWGALPFRVAQLFDSMVESIKNSKQEEFLCAGGVLIHYLGDACQPLHSSYLSQGDPDDLIDKPRSEGKKMRADLVHGGYEDTMVEYGYANKDLAKALEKKISEQEANPDEEIIDIKTGFDAAKAVLNLIQATQNTISPREIVGKWVELKSVKGKDEKSDKMWELLGDRTVECMARGTRYLAKTWQAAWLAGKGNTTIGEGKALKQEDIMALYNNPKFIESLRLDKY